jgi:hypothetical protein
MLQENAELEETSFMSSELVNDTVQLQVAFNSLLDVVGDQSWSYNSLIKFLDNCPEQSIIVNLQVKHLTNQVLFKCFWS